MNTAFWYASRATGIVALLLLTAVLLLGILVNRQGRLPGLPRFAVTSLHRNVSLLAVAFLVVHVLTADLHRCCAREVAREHACGRHRRAIRGGHEGEVGDVTSASARPKVMILPAKSTMNTESALRVLSLNSIPTMPFGRIF